MPGKLAYLGSAIAVPQDASGLLLDVWLYDLIKRLYEAATRKIKLTRSTTTEQIRPLLFDSSNSETVENSRCLTGRFRQNDVM